MKSSYRVLKWVFLVGAMATLGSACVVTSGDGDDDGEGGEGGSDTPTAGKNSAGTGGSSSAGTSSGGKGGTASAGSDAGGSDAGGEGGAPVTYVPGVCESDLATPSMLRDTTLNDDDEKPEFACRKCLKSQCGEDWSTCYGEAPTSACGYGSTEDAPGQFECIRQCYLDDMSGDDAETVLGACEGMCLDQCEEKDGGFSTGPTTGLLGCGQDNCLVECFTP
ncbi:MAG TPA: hypothetical protein VHP33_16455 [Polyangiaceae bacterium]|nr:hypothetical protein [Polyangiaceae bacterium]